MPGWRVLPLPVACMIARLPYLFRVAVSVLHPIVAAKGALIVSLPGHPTHALIVMTADGDNMIRHASPRHVADAIRSFCVDGRWMPLRPLDPAHLAGRTPALSRRWCARGRRDVPPSAGWRRPMAGSAPP